MVAHEREAPAARQAGRSILIAGGGVVGLTLSLALKQALGNGVEIVCADPGFAAPDRPDHRAYAVAASAERMLAALGVWPGVAERAQPITAMEITDSRQGDLVRPRFLDFSGDLEPGRPFAHMVESAPLVAALAEACRTSGVALVAASVRRIADRPRARELVLSDGSSRQVALLVAADGGRSRLRALAGIGWVGWPYGQSALVATISHERPHGGRAFEHFLPSGPFAVLPLVDGPSGPRSSLVWTEATGDATALLSLDPEDLSAEIQRRVGQELGAVRLESPVGALPLDFGMARRFVGERIALVGDAAHVIHPIAGQGLNLGLRDVAALAEAVVDSARLGLDPGGSATLQDYERARRFDTFAMGAATDGLNRLFSNDSTPLRLARDLGLGLVDRMPRLKRRFIEVAAGQRETPRLLRGEAL